MLADVGIERVTEIVTGLGYVLTCDDVGTLRMFWATDCVGGKWSDGLWPHLFEWISSCR